MKMNWKKRLLSYGAIALACVMIGYAGAGIVSAQAETETVTKTVVTSPFTEAVAAVRDSVVGVNNYQTVRYSNGGYGNYGWGDFFGWSYGNPYGYGNGRGQQGVEEQEVLAGTGSGVVISEGYVLTNFHVVENAVKLTVTISEESTEKATEYNAALVAYDENLDVAVIKVADLNVKPVTLGDSDTLQVGDWAICIGNPLGTEFSGTVTAGIISALNRSVASTSTDKYGRRETITNTMIQTDAAINNGNSGGGMFSTSGELMGIPTLKYSGSAFSGASIEGIGMCIPINAAKPIIEEALANGGSVEVPADAAAESADAGTEGSLVGKPRLGVSISSMNASSQWITSGTLPNGVFVNEVEANSPAEAAGMKAGDIIVDVDGTVITGAQQLQGIIAQHAEGDTLAIKVYRAEGILDATTLQDISEGEYVDLQVTLAVVDAVRQ